MDFLLECIGFPPDHSISEIVERVRRDGEPAAWRGDPEEHLRLPLGGGLEVRIDRSRGRGPWNVLPHFQVAHRLRVAVDEIRPLPDSPFDALVVGWAAPPIEPEKARFEPGAYRLSAFVTDHYRTHGVEVHAGKPILYAIGHSAFDQPGYENSKDGLVIRAVVRGKKLVRVSFVPVTRDARNDVMMIDPGSGEGARLLDVVKSVSGGVPLAIDGRADVYSAAATLFEAATEEREVGLEPDRVVAEELRIDLSPPRSQRAILAPGDASDDQPSPERGVTLTELFTSPGSGVTDLDALTALLDAFAALKPNRGPALTADAVRNLLDAFARTRHTPASGRN